jgi:hypothetical protein
MYQLTETTTSILRLADNAFISAEPTNIDYQEYLNWVAAGNEPLPYVPPPVVPPTDWDGFNQAILSNLEFNAAYGAVMASHPLIAAALPAALTQVSTGQTTMFDTIYGQMCAVAEVPLAQREEWATIAEQFHAPEDFVKVIRGIS